MSLHKLSVAPSVSPIERTIARLESQQAERIIATAEYKRMLDIKLEQRQREIDNLKLQLQLTEPANGEPVRLSVVAS